MRGLLLKRPNPLAFPGGSPGFDPSHLAALGCKMSIVNFGAAAVNLVNGQSSATANVPPNPVMDGVVGPALNFPGANPNGIRFATGGTGTQDTVITYAAIVRVSPNGVGSNALMTNSTDSSNGSTFALANSSNIQINFNGSASPQFGGFNLLAGQPYFIALSGNNGGNPSSTSWVFNIIVKHLVTGQVWTVARGTTTVGYSGGAGGGFCYGGDDAHFNDAGTNAHLAAGMFGNGAALTLQQLLQWAEDPWSFWYPQKFDLLQALKAASGILNNQAVSITSSGLLTFVRSTGKKLPVASTGSVSSIKSVAKKIPVSSVGVVSAIKSVAKKLSIASTGSVSAFKSMPKVIAITSVGAVSLLKKAGKIISATSLGAVSMLRANAKKLVITSTGSVSAIKSTTKTILANCTGAVSAAAIKVKIILVAITSVGTVNITRAISKAVSITSTGVVSQIKSIAKTILLSSIGSLIISAIKSGGGVFNVGVNITSAGALSLKRAITKTTLVTSVGTVSVVKSIPRLVLIASTGAVTAIKSVTKTIAASCVGSVTAAGIKVKLILITITSAGSVTLKRAIAKSIAVSSSGSVSVKKAIDHTVSLVSSGAVSVTKSITKTIIVTCVGVASAIAHTGATVYQVTVNIISRGIVRWLPRFVVKGPRESLARLFSNRAKPRTSEWPAAPRDID